MKKSRLRAYARLLAESGVNVQNGQEVIIFAQPDQPEFVRMLAEACYRRGASRVRVEFSWDELKKLDAVWQTEEMLGTVEPWERLKLEQMTKTLPCRIFLLSEDPDALSGVPEPKFSNALEARTRITKPYRDAIENLHQWCIAGVPGVKWAKKVFPKDRAERAVEKLWDAILCTARVTEDPIAEWERHNRELHARCEHLNSLRLRSLHYTTGQGTDLTVGLMPESVFCAGSSETLNGIPYNANIPSEEVFTSPMRGEAEGIVYSSKPLSFMGHLIEDFSIRFEKGRAVEAHAAVNEALLNRLIRMDEGASYLGECALVPKGSPIDSTGILFWNTLYDENASCHLALGEGFAECVRGFESMTLEECRAKGVNTSIIHEDFMIGTADLAIDGTDADGRTVPIFRNGGWAF